jgi:phage baseplate assembly protein W
LSWPFTVGADGNIVTSTSQTKIWNDRVAAVLGTRMGERALRPHYGSSVANAVLSDAHTDDVDITARIGTAFRMWLPELKLQTVTVTGPTTEGVLYVEVEYLGPNESLFSTQVEIGVVSPDGTFLGVSP